MQKWHQQCRIEQKISASSEDLLVVQLNRRRGGKSTRRCRVVRTFQWRVRSMLMKPNVGGQDDQAIGRNEDNKKIMMVAIERKGKGIPRMYGHVIETANKKS
jgi:hypothetical protein